MKVKWHGFDKLEKRLKQMQKAAKELQNTKQVSFDELFTETFMKKHTDFTSFEELLESGGFEVNSQEDFESIPDDVFDKHIAEHTRFSSWQEMLDSAATEYAARKLGF